MAYLTDRDFLIEVSKGKVPGHSIIHKFGRNSAVGTSLVPVASAAVYQTPTTAQSLEFVSSSASDALNSTGAHEITVVGLDANYDEQTVATAAHATDGTVAVAISGTWTRVYRAYVSSSGSYASATQDSHVGTITIRVSGAGSTFATIPLEGTFGLGQSLIGAYTVPSGYTAFILSTDYSSDVSGTKTVDYFFFKRDNADDVTSSYSGVMRVQNIAVGTQGAFEYEHKTNESYTGPCDLMFLAKATSTSDVSVEFELLIVDNTYL